MSAFRPIAITLVAASAALLTIFLPACASPPARSGAEEPAAPLSTQPAIYDTTADAHAQIRAAQTVAQRENQRILVMFGGNWCGWCQKLHSLFKNNQGVAKTLLYEYQLVMVDVGRFDKNLDIASGYKVDLKKTGVPFLTVLDADGKVLANQDTGALEQGNQHDPQKVAAFLAKWKAEPRDAEKMVDAALARAAADRKSVFLHLGAPWCPWCRRLDAFLALPEIADILGQGFIDLKIDVDRMTSAAKIVTHYRTAAGGGIPWFAVLDPQGQILATSDGPKGNIGYPAEAPEINHFLGMLKKGAKPPSAAQLKTIEQALKDAAAKLKTPARRTGA